MRSKLFTEDIYENVFVFLPGSAIDKMKMEKMRMKHKFY